MANNGNILDLLCKMYNLQTEIADKVQHQSTWNQLQYQRHKLNIIGRCWSLPLTMFQYPRHWIKSTKRLLQLDRQEVILIVTLEVAQGWIFKFPGFQGFLERKEYILRFSSSYWLLSKAQTRYDSWDPWFGSWCPRFGFCFVSWGPVFCSGLVGFLPGS